MKTNVSGQGACSKQIELENIKIKAPCSSSFFFFLTLFSVYVIPLGSRFVSYD
jgi:hypothetical protein